MVVVQDVIRVGTKLRCEVLRSHGAVGCVAVAVQPRPVAFEGLTFSRCLCTDLLGSWSACRPWRWLLSTGRRAETWRARRWQCTGASRCCSATGNKILLGRFQCSRIAAIG